MVKNISSFEWTIWKDAIVVSHNPISLNHLLFISKTGSAFLAFEYSAPEGEKLLEYK